MSLSHVRGKLVLPTQMMFGLPLVELWGETREKVAHFFISMDRHAMLIMLTAHDMFTSDASSPDWSMLCGFKR